LQLRDDWRRVYTSLSFDRDHHRAIGPSRIEPASKPKVASHPDELSGPPAKYSHSALRVLVALLRSGAASNGAAGILAAWLHRIF